ncbi:TraB/VirB10 family protein [Herbaspirillum sp.]|uniref:TraB/VirB10 family protein n=1 Tax=Herbaspirillum sp. TaxID=1890675 RepID=UPI000C0B6C0C|nr:TraB/VirB10 family protein [Herbaspirillum sp.]MAF04681.1 type VI secretion protein [Herbaspirillum sp.]
MSTKLKEWMEKKKQEWQDMESHFKWMIYAIIVGGVVLIWYRQKEHAEILAQEEAAKAKKTAQVQQRAAQTQGGAPAPQDPANSISSVLPVTNRNQGLETMKASVDLAVSNAAQAKATSDSQQSQFKKLNDRINELDVTLQEYKRALANKTREASASVGFGLNDRLPDAGGQTLGSGPNAGGNSPMAPVAPVDFNTADVAPAKTERTGPSGKAKVWGDSPVTEEKASKGDDTVRITVPVNSGIEAVMLTGINARANTSGGLPAGSVNSANSVGAPFASRAKGLAVLPNRFKVSELNDCFIGGSGVAVLSAERAKVISDKISCVGPNGEIFEGPIKAYGVDLDGMEGISGRVVTKQGSILAKAALAGVASGLGSALSPQGITGYNSNQTSGQQGIQYVNPSLVAQQSIYGGINSATSMLSKFYLDFAREMFPVIEIDAGTRITWILKESLDLTMKTK